eukprot:7220050-Pyramimonas_sp.AAC.1
MPPSMVASTSRSHMDLPLRRGSPGRPGAQQLVQPTWRASRRWRGCGARCPGCGVDVDARATTG